jgi:hypothetical protein
MQVPYQRATSDLTGGWHVRRLLAIAARCGGNHGSQSKSAPANSSGTVAGGATVAVNSFAGDSKPGDTDGQGVEGEFGAECRRGHLALGLSLPPA